MHISPPSIHSHVTHKCTPRGHKAHVCPSTIPRTSPISHCFSVSTTLPGSSKKHLLSPSSSSGENPPWSSTAPSSLQLSFPAPVAATHVAFTFQGGFVGTSVSVWVAEEKDAEKEGVIRLGLELGGKVYPEDRNKRQIFEQVGFYTSASLQGY